MFVYVNSKTDEIMIYSSSDKETFPLPSGDIGVPSHIKIVEFDESKLPKEQREKFHIYFRTAKGELVPREAKECEVLLSQKEGRD